MPNLLCKPIPKLMQLCLHRNYQSSPQYCPVYGLFQHVPLKRVQIEHQSSHIRLMSRPEYKRFSEHGSLPVGRIVGTTVRAIEFA
jgi:hypothetical protein